MAETITCPKCGAEIEVAQALSERLATSLRAEFEAKDRLRDEAIARREAAVRAAKERLEADRAALDEKVSEQLKAREAALKARLKKQADEDAAAEVQTLNEQLAEMKVKLGTAKKAEAEARRKELELKEREEQLALEVEKAVQQERTKIREAARAQALEQAQAESAERDAELDRLRAVSEEQEKRLAQARATELGLVKREAALRDREASVALDVERQLLERQQAIKEEARRQVEEQHRLREAEQDKKITDLVSQMEEWKRRAEQGSQQLQGEVQELVLEDELRRRFPFDAIEEVPKGMQGADTVHRVRDATAAECGVILWESKRTRNWSDGWLAKLRDDQRAAKADLAVLVSEALPRGCDTFAFIDGIWVTSWSCAFGLAEALRMSLQEVGKARRATQGQQGKMEMLYGYLTGPEFAHRVTGIVESFSSLRDDLQDEKRAMQRIWAKREKQLERALTSSSGLYGDLQGIVGRSLPAIETLELPAGIEAPVASGHEGESSGVDKAEGADDELVVVSATPVSLDRAIRFLREHPGFHGRQELVDGAGIDEREWSDVADQLATDPRVERAGVKRGTRYRWVGRSVVRPPEA